MHQCPHCNKAIHFEPSKTCAFENESEDSGNTGYDIASGFCPACKQLIVLLRDGIFHQGHEPLVASYITDVEKIAILYPKFIQRHVEPEVPDNYAEEFQEANAVLNVSAKASAAISRRLLQSILRDEFKIKPSSLSKEIDIFLTLKDVPTFLAEAVDAIRNIGNFAAHPLKDTSTGEMIDVEIGEAEWLLDVLEALLDFTFIQPKRIEQHKKQLNEKLRKIGKPPMK
jgi:hypothetical protein